MTEKLSMIPLDQIRPPKTPIRREVDRQGIMELADSIRMVGLIEPLILEKTGTRYAVIAGHRRFLAAKMCGLDSVPAIVTTLDDLARAAISWHENVFREDVQPEHEASFIRILMERHQATQADIAKLLGRSEGWISDRLRILEYPECLRDALARKEISFAAARELAHITDTEELERLVIQAVAGGCSGRQAWQAKINPPPPYSPPPQGRGIQGESPSPYKITCQICGAEISAQYEKIIRTCPNCYGAIMRPQQQAERDWPQPPEKGGQNGV
jgi:ParB family chromosome partitioning protein